MNKPHPSSVTDIKCSCGVIESMITRGDGPFVIDEETNEYQLKYRACNGANGSLIVYHCPFCGGVAKESKRDKLFHEITKKEEDRLKKMTDGIRTLKQCYDKLGRPDDENDRGSSVIHPASVNNPQKIEYFKVATYYKLSSSVDVWVTEYPGGQVSITFQGKYKGKTKSPG